MARPLRIEFPGAVYHLTSRGDRRQEIFADDMDRSSFLYKLAREVHQQAWLCHAYCLMNNHYHLLVETPEPNLAKGMRRLNGSYTQAFNRRHDKVGHVFQGRYRSILVEKDRHLLELSRYVVLNPIRAGMISSPEDWPWSNYRATAGIEIAPPWLTTHWILDLFGRDHDTAREAYRRFVESGRRSRSPWDNLRGQIYLGGEEFLERMQTLTKDLPMEEVPRMQRTPVRPPVEEILDHIGEAYGLSPEVILTRSDYEAFMAAVYLLRRVANVPLKEVAEMAGVSGSRISQIQRRIEDGSGPQDEKFRSLARYYKLKI